jgi:hypothetical protein
MVNCCTSLFAPLLGATLLVKPGVKCLLDVVVRGWILISGPIVRSSDVWNGYREVCILCNPIGELELVWMHTENVVDEDDPVLTVTNNVTIEWKQAIIANRHGFPV